MKKAYAVIVYENINDNEKLKAYMAITPKLLAQWGAKFLSRGYPVSLKENAKNERTIIVEFSSVEKAEEFYASPEYKVALDALEGGAVRSFKICESYE